MLKAGSSTVGWFLTVEYLIGPILGFLVLVVFPFLVIRSISRESKAVEIRRAVSQEVEKRLASIDVSSGSSQETPEPKASTNAPKSKTSTPDQVERLRRQLEAQRAEFQRKIELVEATYLQELENLDESHSRELSKAVARATRETKESIDQLHEAESKRLELSRRETTRKNSALLAKFLSSQGPPSWDTYSSTMEFLGGHPKFPYLTREICANLLDLSSSSEISNSKGVVELCHHLVVSFLNSDEISTQDKSRLLTSCRWLSTSQQKLNEDVFDDLGELSDAKDPESRIIEAFSLNFVRAAKIFTGSATNSKLKDYSICINCGSRIEKGRTRCREACGYS